MKLNMGRFSRVKVLLAAAALLAVFALPAYAADMHERAKNLYDVGDYHAALSLYERILRNDPDDGLAWDLSAWCLRYLGEAKSSEEHYKKALLLLKGPDAIWSFIGLGELYLDGGRCEDALVKLREAKGLASGNDEAMERAARDIEIAEKMLADARPPVSDDTDPAETEMTDTADRLGQALLGKTNEPPGEANAPPGETNEPQGETKTSLDETKTPPEPAAPEPATPKSADVADVPKSVAVSANAASKDVPAATKTEQPKPKPKSAPKPKPKPKPVPAPATPRPPRSDVIYGVKLGSPITEALEVLKKQGCRVGGEPFARNGREFYPVTGLKAGLPDAITDGAARRRFYVVASGGAVLSVNVELDYGNEVKFSSLKAAARGEIGNISGLGDTRGLVQVSNIFSYELNLAVSNTYGVSMLVVDKGNGTSRVEIQHIDLYGLSDYLSGKNAE
jgi:hypothetical protein